MGEQSSVDRFRLLPVMALSLMLSACGGGGSAPAGDSGDGSQDTAEQSQQNPSDPSSGSGSQISDGGGGPTPAVGDTGVDSGAGTGPVGDTGNSGNGNSGSGNSGGESASPASSATVSAAVAGGGSTASTGQGVLVGLAELLGDPGFPWEKDVPLPTSAFCDTGSATITWSDNGDDRPGAGDDFTLGYGAGECESSGFRRSGTMALTLDVHTPRELAVTATIDHAVYTDMASGDVVSGTGVLSATMTSDEDQPNVVRFTVAGEDVDTTVNGVLTHYQLVDLYFTLDTRGTLESSDDIRTIADRPADADAIMLVVTAPDGTASTIEVPDSDPLVYVGGDTTPRDGVFVRRLGEGAGSFCQRSEYHGDDPENIVLTMTADAECDGRIELTYSVNL
ncbi:MAG TPA: hypothetical protein ENJ19_07215 [Gammaproteobacteria bacterium]|nr:hypothetical protein [Gammaproteobacteria bacterium]